MTKATKEESSFRKQTLWTQVSRLLSPREAKKRAVIRLLDSLTKTRTRPQAGKPSL